MKMQLRPTFAILLLPLVFLSVCVSSPAQYLPLIPGSTSGESTATGEIEKPSGIRWKPLMLQSLFFLGIEHGFRFATEAGTRDGMNGHFVQGWARSVGNLHGWADGDPFLVNYVGHPMQGSVVGFVFVQNDPKYQKVEFGDGRDYWRSRIRATAFAWAYSEQFEIGPLSEASLGKVQSYYPQQGFVDHVVTPVIGLGWMMAEDAVDRYIIKRIEDHTTNRWARMMVRGWLNPSRSMANILRLEPPWHRDSRPGITVYNPNIWARTPVTSLGGDGDGDGDGGMYSAPIVRHPSDSHNFPEIAPFEFAVQYTYMQLAIGQAGSQSCNGGGATGSFNLNRWASVVAEVGGCKMMLPGHNISGDSLTYLVGPRISFRNSDRWTPYLQVLVGGEKLTEETIYPNKVPPMTHELMKIDSWKVHPLYTQTAETNAFAMSFGGGVDYTINRAIAIRVGDIEYLRTWNRDLNNVNYANNLRFTTGLVLRVGTW